MCRGRSAELGRVRLLRVVGYQVTVTVTGQVGRATPRDALSPVPPRLTAPGSALRCTRRARQRHPSRAEPDFATRRYPAGAATEASRWRNGWCGASRPSPRATRPATPPYALRHAARALPSRAEGLRSPGRARPRRPAGGSRRARRLGGSARLGRGPLGRGPLELDAGARLALDTPDASTRLDRPEGASRSLVSPSPVACLDAREAEPSTSTCSRRLVRPADRARPVVTSMC